MGESSQLFGGRGVGSTFWRFTVSLRTMMSPVDVWLSFLMHYNEHVVGLSIQWRLICPLSWTQLLQPVCAVSLGHAIPSQVVPYTLGYAKCCDNTGKVMWSSHKSGRGGTLREGSDRIVCAGDDS